MKVSKAEQEKNRRQAVHAAVELIAEQGVDATTMKQIARKAEIGEATLYRYFSSKEKLMMAFFAYAVEDALDEAGETPGFEEYTLQEKLQRLVDAFLERMLAERDFVDMAAKAIGKSPLLALRDRLPGQPALRETIQAYLVGAEDSGEIASCPLKGAIAGLFADYLFGIVVYWLRDDSEEFSNTTQLVDLTLSVLVLSLRSGVTNKIGELLSFLVRGQLSRLLQNGSGMIDMLQAARNRMKPA